MKSTELSRKFLLVVTLLTNTIVGFAQVSIAPRVGLQVARINSSFGGNTSSRLGMSIGATLNVKLGRCSLQPALVYVQRGALLTARNIYSVNASDPYQVFAEYATTVNRYKLNYLELPVNLVYNAAGEEGGNGFQTVLGVYAALGVSGTNDGTVEYRQQQNSPAPPTRTVRLDKKIDFINDLSAATYVGQYVRSTDFGGQVGIGYLYRSLQLQALYQLGFTPLEPKVNGRQASSQSQHRVVQVTLNYFLRLKPAR